MDKQGIIEASRKRREGERIFYTSCPANGCWDSACVLKCHVKDEKLIAVEPDDSVNPNDSREDCGWENTWKGNVQMRPCAMGHSWKKELHADTRLLHPMKRVGEKGPGRGYFVQISWEEALDTIAEKMIEIKEKYGPYGIFHSQYPSFEKNGFPLAPWWEAGFGAWGEHSTSGHAAGEMLHLGVDLTKVTRGLQNSMPGFEAPDLFNSKLFVMWGMDPVVAWFGPTSYYMQLAHEYGCKTIVIDPRYTQSAEILADQWIPIRPGTDAALVNAIAHEWIVGDEIDLDFLHTYCVGYDEETLPESAKGQNKSYRDYIMGTGYDMVEKTPEWAAPITGISAETIRSLAREIADAEAPFIVQGWGPQRRTNGETATRAIALLPQLVGQVGLPSTNSGLREGNGGFSLNSLPTGDNPITAKFPNYLWPEAIKDGTKLTALNAGIQGADALPAPIKMMINYGNNMPANQNGDINFTTDILRDDSLCAVSYTHLTLPTT